MGDGDTDITLIKPYQHFHNLLMDVGEVSDRKVPPN